MYTVVLEIYPSSQLAMPLVFSEIGTTKIITDTNNYSYKYLQEDSSTKDVHNINCNIRVWPQDRCTVVRKRCKIQGGSQEITVMVG